MRILHTVLALGLCGSALSGCMNTAEDKDLEGISLAGGNAIAVNTALQVIDPWPAGVQDTDFPVPRRPSRRIDVDRRCDQRRHGRLDLAHAVIARLEQIDTALCKSVEK